MLIPLSKAAMALHSCSSDQLPFYFLFKNLLPPDCLPTCCDTSSGVLEVSLGFPLNLYGGGSVAVISTIGEATHPTPLALNLLDLFWGGEALGMLWLLKRQTPVALSLWPVAPPHEHGSYEPPPLTVLLVGAPRLSTGTSTHAPPPPPCTSLLRQGAVEGGIIHLFWGILLITKAGATSTITLKLRIFHVHDLSVRLSLHE
jgi:hypothetical protein